MSSPLRTWPQRAIRWSIAGILFMTPLIGDHLPLFLFPIAIGVITAYEGLDQRTVIPTALYLVVAELVWGMALGSWSLAYLFTALVFRSGEGFISLVPWAHERTWSLAAVVRTILVAAVLATIMSGISVLIQSGIYFHLSLKSIISVWAVNALRTAPIASVLIIIGTVMVARIDMPFRRRLRFGT